MRLLKLSIFLFIITVSIVYSAESDIITAGNESPTYFQYNGILIQNGVTIYGTYDFEFVLYDSPNDVNLAAMPVFIEDVNVIDGHYSVEMDFGSGVFDRNPRWLEIWSKLAGTKNPYITSGKREKLSPVPYALFAYDSNNTSTIGNENISRNSLNAADGNPSDAVFVDNEGNVGIGTLNPYVKLDVEGHIKVNGFIMPSDAYDGYVLTADSFGVGTWQPFPNISSSGLGGSGTTNFLSKFTSSNTLGISSIFETDGKVGIGTTSPGTKLEVQGGAIKAAGGLIIETRTSDPTVPITGQIWLRTDL